MAKKFLFDSFSQFSFDKALKTILNTMIDNEELTYTKLGKIIGKDRTTVRKKLKTVTHTFNAWQYIAIRESLKLNENKIIEQAIIYEVDRVQPDILTCKLNGKKDGENNDKN